MAVSGCPPKPPAESAASVAVMNDPSFLTMRGPALTRSSSEGAYRVTLTVQDVKLYHEGALVANCKGSFMADEDRSGQPRSMACEAGRQAGGSACSFRGS
jgi:hypothetical protein